MKNIARCRCILLPLLISFLSINVYADGKFYSYNEKIPADIPYQRAFIIFHENTETLILQSKYEISKSQLTDSLGWVVPVPSVPEITSFDADIARRYFNTSSTHTQPRIIIIRDILIILIYLIFLFSCLSMITLFILFPFVKFIGMPREKWHKLANISFYTFLISFFIGLFFGVFMPALGKQERREDVEIIKTETAGIYDVKVIKSDSTEAILDWLKEDSFNFDANDSDVFSDYISRNWCFVVAKVRPEPGTQEDKISNNGLVAPLILKFDTEKAIYPTALTATIGTKTQILLYTLSDNKLDCKDRLKLRAARKTFTIEFKPGFMISEEEIHDKLFDDIFKNLPRKMMICKFKETLTAKQMKEDIVMEDAPDNKPYYETKVAW